MNVALRPSPVNLISLCTGGGGLDIGIELACPAVRSVCLVEREAFSVAHLVAAMQEGRMAPAPVWSDVRTFAGRSWRGLVDGLIGGIPCQPHSLAGKRLGEEDERDLWSSARRIIVQSGVWFVVIENVEGMLTSGGAERVIRDLRRLGFTVEIGLFSATEAGASHQRNRVFIVAVADARRERDQRRGAAGDLSSSARDSESQGHQWQRHGHAAGDGSEDLADADGEGLERHRRYDERPGECAARPRGDELEHASIERWREGRPEPELRSGRDTAAGASVTVADAESEGRFRVPSCRRQEIRDLAGSSTIMGDAIGSGHDGRSHDAERRPIERADSEGAGGTDFLGLFPPGPSDLDGWRRVLEDSPHLEPAVRRMADGVAARLDLAGPHTARIERLRMLGNGVVPLQAAFAFRTLAHRLAQQGHDRLWKLFQQ